MAIRVMHEGNIECDKCGKHLAKITASKEVFQALLANNEVERFCTVTCDECVEKEKTDVVVKG
mgnify:CR=1 FL=1